MFIVAPAELGGRKANLVTDIQSYEQLKEKKTRNVHTCSLLSLSPFFSKKGENKRPTPLLFLCMHSQSLQSCLPLRGPMDGSPPESTGFSRQERWSGLPCPPPGGLPQSGTEPTSPALAGRLSTSRAPGKPLLSFPLQQIQPGHPSRGR